jgi:hypothetical protein
VQRPVEPVESELVPLGVAAGMEEINNRRARQHCLPGVPYTFGSNETISLGREVGLKRIPASNDLGSNNGVRSWRSSST